MQPTQPTQPTVLHTTMPFEVVQPHDTSARIRIADNTTLPAGKSELVHTTLITVALTSPNDTNYLIEVANILAEYVNEGDPQ